MPKPEPIRSSSRREGLILKYCVSSSHFRSQSAGDPPDKWTECYSYEAELITEPEKHRAYPDIPVGIWTVNINRTVKFQRKRSHSGHRKITQDTAVFSISLQKLRVQSVSNSIVTVEVTATSEQCPSFRMNSKGAVSSSTWNWPVSAVSLDLSVIQDYTSLKRLPRMTFQLLFIFSSEPEKEVTHDVRYMLNFPADCILVASDGREFHAHRSVLGARSAVFSAMFQHDTTEKEEGVVQITDISGYAVEAFLVFLYDHTLDADQVKDYVEELYYAADKYDLEDLRAVCEKILCATLETKNAIKRLAFADDRGLVKLKKSALEFVTENKSNI